MSRKWAESDVVLGGPWQRFFGDWEFWEHCAPCRTLLEEKYPDQIATMFFDSIEHETHNHQDPDRNLLLWGFQQIPPERLEVGRVEEGMTEQQQEIPMGEE